jgi:ATP-dependent Clp protease ATP-binding subunit ClpA
MFLFGSEENLIQLICRIHGTPTRQPLVGAPPGYVGYEEAAS